MPIVTVIFNLIELAYRDNNAERIVALLERLTAHFRGRPITKAELDAIDAASRRAGQSLQERLEAERRRREQQ